MLVRAGRRDGCVWRERACGGGAGRLNIFDYSYVPRVNGPAKLVIMDIVSMTVLREFVFPDSVAPWDSSFCNDLVVDEVNMVAYIADAGDVVRGGRCPSAGGWGCARHAGAVVFAGCDRGVRLQLECAVPRARRAARPAA